MKPLLEQIKQLASLSSPLLIVKMGVPIRGLVITWIFAQLGSQTLEAGALAYSLLMTIITFFLGVLMPSVGISVAYATGENDKDEVTRVLQQGLWLAVLLSIPSMLILYNTGPILLLLGQNKAIVALAAQFADGLAWLFIPYGVLVNAYKLFTNIKKTYIPMLYSLWGLVVTLVVSYLLAFGKLGLPEMGIAGVGWGMAIAYWSQAIIIVFHLAFGKNTREYGIFTHFPRPKLHYLRQLWEIGWPIGLKYNVEFFLFFVIAAILGILDHNDLAVYQVVLQFFMLSSCLSSGVGLGTEVLVGQAIGAQHITRVKPACYAGLLLATAYIAIVGITMLSFPHGVAHLFFEKDTPAFGLLLSVLGWAVAFQFLDSLRKVMTDILVVLKDSRFPLLAEVIGLWGIGLPVGYLLGSSLYHDRLTGFLAGLMMGSLISVGAMFVRGHYQLLNVIGPLNRQHESQNTPKAMGE